MCRFLVKSAYGIENPVNDCCVDVLISFFCGPCSTNQIYQTTEAYGNPAPGSGREFNKGVLTVSII